MEYRYLHVPLILLGTMVALMNKAGGSAAFGEWAKKACKDQSGSAAFHLLLGVLIFVDDYFNCLTVGSVMMPVTDGHKISEQSWHTLLMPPQHPYV